MPNKQKVHRPVIGTDAYKCLVLMAAYEMKTPREWIEHHIFNTWSNHERGDVDFPSLRGVYFLMDESINMVKIGVSSDPYRRVDNIGKEQKKKLRLIGLIYVVNSAKLLNYEKDVHIKFAHLRDHGEWFRAEEELLEWIKSNNKSIW